MTVEESGALRICIDPRPLNTALKRKRYQLPVLEDILLELSKARVFSTVNLKSGYWHCVLAPESSILTTFATPYKCKIGLSASSQIFQHLTHADDEAKPQQESTRSLQRCKDHDTVLIPDKMKLMMSEVNFMGHLLTNKGLKPEPAKVEAITKIPKPQDVEGIQRGFVNYLVSKFLPKLSEVMEPIHCLTRKDTPWNWSLEQTQAIANVQWLVTEAPVLRYYDPSLDLTIQSDASQSGLGAAILRNGKPIEYASHSLTNTETQCAQIEKEMLAIVFSFGRFNQNTFG